MKKESVRSATRMIDRTVNNNKTIKNHKKGIRLKSQIINLILQLDHQKLDVFIINRKEIAQSHAKESER